MAIAADLCVLLVTSPVAAAAFPQQVQVSPGKGPVNYLQHAAATALRMMASRLCAAATPFMSLENTLLPAAFVSDSVQRAMVLHLAACMPYCMEQMAQSDSNCSASSSRGGRRANSKGSTAVQRHAPPSLSDVAAAEAVAREQLQRLAFQRPQDVQQYGHVACDDSGVISGGIYGSGARGHLCAAYGGLQLAFGLRRQALGQPGWPDLYRGAITCPPAALAIETVDPGLSPAVAPGIDPLLLHELLLHLMIVLGPSNITGTSAGLGMIANSLQPATPRSAEKAHVARCLQLLWLRLGQQVQRAAGVKEDELNADAVDVGPEGHMGVLIDGVAVQVAATVRDMLKQYGYMLIWAFTWQNEFLPSADAIFAKKPQLACRVLEAAVRTFTWPAPFLPEPVEATDIARHFGGMYLAAAACSPASPKLAAQDRSSPKLVLRCCSLMVSALKQVQQQVAEAAGGSMLPGWHAEVLPQLLAIACLVAGLGADVSGAATTEAPGQGTAGPEGSSSATSGGASTAWLALSGRGIAGAGCVLACPAAVLWLQDCMRAEDSSVRVTALQQFARLHQATEWVAEQLDVRQQESTTATTGVLPSAAAEYAAPAVDATSLRKLQQQVVALLKQWQPLQDACTAALASSDSGSSSKQAQVSADYGAACGAGGWLPAGLQELGEGVWSAFPQKYGCGYPACVNLRGLIEASATTMPCTGCKPEGVRYCCKEHQVRHWPQHKKACKAIKQALAANSGQ